MILRFQSQRSGLVCFVNKKNSLKYVPLWYSKKFIEVFIVGRIALALETTKIDSET